MLQNFKNLIRAVMSYNMKLVNFADWKPTNKITAGREQYCCIFQSVE